MTYRPLQRCSQRVPCAPPPPTPPPLPLQDAFRRFKGPDGYARLDFVATSVGDPAVSIQSMRMLDNSAAEIRWRLTGRVGPLPVDVEGGCVVVVVGADQQALL